MKLLPSRQAWAGLLLGALLLAWWPALGLAVNAACVLLFLLDAYIARRLGSPVIDLELPARLGQGESSRARLELGNPLRARRRLRLVLDLPLDLAGEGALEPRQLEIPARGRAELAFPLEARNRGRRPVPALHFRVLGPLGFGWWQGEERLDREVEVLPGLREVRSLRLLAQHHHLQQMGLRSVRQRGAGGAFESLREYVRGDDTRNMDWKASARRPHLMVRQYEAERSQNIILCVDAGRAMLEESGPSARLDQALAAAVALHEVARVWNDHVGLFAFSDRIHAVLPAGRHPPNRLPRLLASLEARNTEPDYPRALARLARLASRRSLLVFFGDVIDDEVSGPLAAQLARLARRHLPLFIALRSRELFAASLAPAPDRAAACRRAAATELVLARHRSLARMRERGILVADVLPEAAVASVVNRYLEVKRRGML